MEAVPEAVSRAAWPGPARIGPWTRATTVHPYGLISPLAQVESWEWAEPRPGDPPPTPPPPPLQQNLDQAHPPHPGPPEGRPPGGLQPNRWGLGSGTGGLRPEGPRTRSSDPSSAGDTRFRVQGSGFWVQGSGFWVLGSGVASVDAGVQFKHDHWIQ